MTKGASIECKRCGACCRLLVSVPLDSGLPISMMVPYGNWWHDEWVMRQRADGYCVALKGKPGERCRCSIYESRPDDCREFDAGSRGCQWARQDAGLEDADGNAEAGTHSPLREAGGADS